jgi:CTP synthase
MTRYCDYRDSGTVGDIESLPYIESVRQLVWELGEHNGIVIHLTLVPFSCCR